MFAKILREVLGHVDEALCVSLMGTDGIPIEEVVCDGGDRELNRDLISAEYAALQKRIAKTNEGLDLRELREVLIATDTLLILVRMVSSDYFLLLMMAPRGGVGRARYELRKAEMRLQREIA